MPRFRSWVPLVVALVVLGTSSATAIAGSTPHLRSPITDCQRHNGTLTGTYTAKQLRAALNHMTAGIKEYTDCYSAIQNALSQAGGVTNLTDQGSGGTSGGGSGTTILVIVLVLVLVGGGGAAGWAYRRTRRPGV